MYFKITHFFADIQEKAYSNIFKTTSYFL